MTDGQIGKFGRAPRVGRILTDPERMARKADETARFLAGETLRTGFAVSDKHVLTAWHCVAASVDERVWLRLRQHTSEHPRYAYVPLRLANYSQPIDVAVLALDKPSLGEASLTEESAAEMLRAASIPLSAEVQLRDYVRVIGFPLSAPSADSDVNAASVIDLELPIGDVTAVKLFGDAFAAMDPVNPRGLSGGPVLKQLPTVAPNTQRPEAAVAVVRGVPRGRYPYTSSGGSLIATHIADVAAALPEIAGLLDARGDRRSRPAGPDSASGATEATHRVVPRQLPPNIAHFTGRGGDVAYLDGLLAATPNPHRTAVISAIDGTAGVGKTALAIHWAYRVRDRFPDGDLYVNLHGYDFSAPVSAPDVMEYFLRALGVPPEEVPRDMDARTSLYRSILYDRTVLLVLDNAASVEQVSPLLPTSDSAFALVTSRSRLPGLAATHATAQLSLDLLTEAEATALLEEIIGPDRARRAPDVAARIISQCARLPLALRIVAENITTRPRASLATISHDLSSHGCTNPPIARFSTPDESVALETVFDWSYEQLLMEDARVFRRLGLHPGAEMSGESAAALVMVPLAATHRPLFRLVNVHMVEEIGDGRFSFHDLLRLYARTKCEADDEEDVRSAAFKNLAAWYIHTANNANKLLLKRSPIDVDNELAGTEPLAFENFTDALSWCELERDSLTLLTRQAYEHGLLDIAWRLPDVLRGFYNLRKHWSDWEMTHGIALQAAAELADPHAEASVMNGLGTLMKQTGRSAEAVGYHQDALARRRSLGDKIGVASSLDGLGHAYRDVGQHDNAVKCFQEALEIRRGTGDRKGQGWSYNNLGEAELEAGRPGVSLRFFRLALAARVEVRDEWGQGRTLHGMGQAHVILDDLTEARARYADAVKIRREISDRWGVAQSLNAWGDAERQLGDPARARILWREALAILIEIGDFQAGDVAAKLAALDAEQGQAATGSSLTEAGGAP
ncbi:MAG: tetratricopeptide repeat protein [Trebonia sp.]